MIDENDIHVGIVRRYIVAMLIGNVEQVEELLKLYHNNPIPIANINYNGVETQVNSHLFSYVLYDAFRYERQHDLFESRCFQAILDLHERLCPPMLHPDYSKFNFLSYKGELNSFYDDEIAILIQDGASQQDIDLTNYGLQYKENELIGLLKNGASPYFLNRTDLDGDEDGECYYSYNEIAPLLCCLQTEISDQWQFEDLDAILDEESLPHTNYLEHILLGLFNIAASYRILYLVDKFMTPQVRIRGKDLMKKYCLKEYPIIDLREFDENLT